MSREFETGEKVWWPQGPFTVLGIFKRELENGTSEVRSYQRQNSKYSDHLTPRTDSLHSIELEGLPEGIQSLL